MSELSELLAYHSNNPIGNILEDFRINYATTSVNEALSKFYENLALYAYRANRHIKIDEIVPILSHTHFNIRAGEIKDEYFHPLINAILDNETESDILKISVSLIEEEAKGGSSVNRRAKKQKVQSALEQTKSKTTFTVNPLETPGFDINAKDLENLLESELDSNVFYEIKNFWAVFFENKGWSKQTCCIWESYQKYEKAEEEIRSKEIKQLENQKDTDDLISRHKAKFEKILEEDMQETEVWDWLKFFKNVFLDQLEGSSSNPSKVHPIVSEDSYIQLNGQYCSTEPTARATRPTEKIQIDFLIKSIDRPNDGPADWENIDVLGELTKSPDGDVRKRKFLQLSRGVLEVFYAQPLRRFLHGFCLFRSGFELWVFDRSGAYSSGVLSLVKDKEIFIRAISSYLLMSNDELGCDKSILQNGDDKSVKFPGSGDVPGLVFEIKSQPTVRPRRMITRATTCFETKDASKIIKYSWTDPKENNEVDFLKVAKTVRGVVDLIAAEVIYETDDHLQELQLSSAQSWNLNGKMKYICKGLSTEEAKIKSFKRNRRLTRIAMTPCGRTIYSGGSILDFVAGIRDAIIGHEGLVDREILHGDISEGNIMLLKPTPDNDLHGMLIDLDHSVKMVNGKCSEDGRFLTGTMKFMALERMDNYINGKYYGRSCRHDLESFFYVFIVGCIEYEKVPSKMPYNLDSWCTVNIKTNYSVKYTEITQFEKTLKKFTTSFSGLKELATKLRTILFNNGVLNIETPKDCRPLYRNMIKAFDETIVDIKAGRIENRTFKAR